jgi:hypothetical protein
VIRQPWERCFSRAVLPWPLPLPASQATQEIPKPTESRWSTAFDEGRPWLVGRRTKGNEAL